MSTRDDLLPDVSDIRGIPEDFGVRTIVAKLALETWTGDIGTSGATASTTLTRMVPLPKVRKASEEVSLFYGQGPTDAVTGSPRVDVFEVGPITPSHSAGGYSVAQLLSSTTPTPARRCLISLAGDGIGTTPTTDVLFEIVNLDTSRPFRTMLTVRRAAQTPV